MCMAGCSAGTTCATPRRRGDCRAPRLWSRRCGRNTRSKSCWWRSEEHTSELQSRLHLVCRLLLEKKKKLHRADDVGAMAAERGLPPRDVAVSVRGALLVGDSVARRPRRGDVTRPPVSTVIIVSVA